MKHVGILGLALAVSLAGCGDDGPTGPTGEQPTITGASPAEGTAGTEVRIDGSGFVDGASVSFGDLTADSVDLEAGALFAFAPAGLVAGESYDIAVTNPGGKSHELAAAFLAVAPSADRINGVSKPTGLRGMTIIIEGSGFGDALRLSGGKVWFANTDGTEVEAVIADSATDWTDGFIVTSVPAGVTDTSWIRVETATGASASIEFRIIQSGTFSPSLINWTKTTSLPQPLQGLGAVFVPVEEGSSPANHVFVVGGADAQGAPVDVAYRATILESGALSGEWAVMPALPEARAYHATAAATGYTASLDTTTTAGYLYVIGGQDTAGAAVADVFVGHVDLAGELAAWTSTTSLPEALVGARAVLFRGFIYLTGGLRADGSPSATVYRAAVHEDGTLGDWEDLGTDMPLPAAYHSLLNFGPFLYAVGGDSTAVLPGVQGTTSGGELADVYMTRVNLRTGELGAWEPGTTMGKGRSKHSTVFAGGDLFVTSGMYAGVGTSGASENVYGSVASDGTVSSWNGATGSNTINAVLGINLYNQAAITFIDATGAGHVLVLGGADRSAEGVPSDGVVYY